MPKRKSNSNKKLKPILKPKTRSLTKKSGLKKSTKIIIGVVCVLGIVGIIVGIIVGTGTGTSGTSGNAGNAGTDGNAGTSGTSGTSTDLLTAFPSPKAIISDQQIFDKNIEPFDDSILLISNYKTDLKKNYIDKFKCLCSKQIFKTKHTLKMFIRLLLKNKAISDIHESRDGLPYGSIYYLKDNIILYKSNENEGISTDNSSEYNNLLFLTEKLNSLLSEDDNETFLNMLDYIGSNEISVMVKTHIIDNTNINHTNINHTNSNHTNINHTKNTNVNQNEVIDNAEINLDDIVNKCDKTLKMIDEVSNNLINKLYELTRLEIPIGNHTDNIKIIPINITKKIIADMLEDYEYEKIFFNELYKYNILKINYEYIKLKYNYVNKENLIFGEKNDPPEEEEVTSYIYYENKEGTWHLDISSEFYEVCKNYGHIKDTNFFVGIEFGNTEDEYITEHFLKFKDILVEKREIEETTDINVLSTNKKQELLKGITQKEAFNATTEKLKTHNEAYIEKFKAKDIDIEIENLSGLEEINKLILDDFNLSN
jgi:hypothetical protein